MRNFYTAVIMPDKRFNSVSRINDLKLLEPVLREKVITIINQANANKSEFIVFETFRSKARQQHLFEIGVTKLAQVGVHHFGLACDLVRCVNGQLSWEEDYTQLGELAVQNGLIWGGDWGMPHQPNGFVDAAHIQRCSIAKQESLFSMEWYPSDDYDAFLDH